MDDLMKKNLAEETIRQKEIAKQMAQQMLKQKQQEAGQVDVSGNRDRDAAKDRSRKLDELLSGKDSSKSEFDKYLDKVDVVIKTGISDLLVGRGRMATDSMLDSLNLDDALPVFAENPEILDASQDMALSLTDQDPKISSFYDKIKDKVNQYKAEKAITETDVDDTADKNIFGDMDDNDSGSDHGFLDEDEIYDVQVFINFKDAFVQHFKSQKSSSDDDLSKDLDSQMASFLGDYTDRNPPMLGSGAPDAGSKHDYTSYKGINDKLYEDDSSFQEDQSTQLNFLRQLCPKGMMGAIMLAFFVAQQAMQENMKGPASDVYSTSGSVTRLAQFASAMKKIPNTDDAGNPITVYKTKLDTNGKVIFDRDKDGNLQIQSSPTLQNYLDNLFCSERGVAREKAGDDKSKLIPTTSKAAAGLVDFIRDSAKIFGSSLDDMMPTSLDKDKITPANIASIGDAYKMLMGTSTNEDSGDSKGHNPQDGIVAKWFLKNDPHNASQILQTLNGGGYKIYEDGDKAYNQYGSIKDGLSANLSTSTAALNLGQSQQNANNTAFYGWMKAWEDNAIEIARKTG